VTTLDALTAAVQGDEKKTVIIDGTVYSLCLHRQRYSIWIGNLTGDAVVRIGSNTSVIGKQGSCDSVL